MFNLIKKSLVILTRVIIFFSIWLDGQSYILIQYVCLSVRLYEWTEPHFFQDEAPFFIHPKFTDWARAGMTWAGTARAATTWAGTARADWARARAGWARLDCVRTSRVPTSLIYIQMSF